MSFFNLHTLAFYAKASPNKTRIVQIKTCTCSHIVALSTLTKGLSVLLIEPKQRLNHCGLALQSSFKNAVTRNGMTHAKHQLNLELFGPNQYFYSKNGE
jgi:hypothetical protein